jgi:hypothetical protein
MAIPDIAARLAFLNREALHAELAAVLKSHRDNIELVAGHSPAPATVGETP